MAEAAVAAASASDLQKSLWDYLEYLNDMLQVHSACAGQERPPLEDSGLLAPEQFD